MHDVQISDLGYLRYPWGAEVDLNPLSVLGETMGFCRRHRSRSDYTMILDLCCLFNQSYMKPFLVELNRSYLQSWKEIGFTYLALKELTLFLLMTTQEAFVDNVDQDQTAQNVLFDLWSTLSTFSSYITIESFFHLAVEE